MIREGITAQYLNEFSKSSMVHHIGIEFTGVGADFIEATMPVDQRTHQPYGLLHGGASVVLAETLGSVSAHFCLTNDDQYVVGQEINANHLRSQKTGIVTGRSEPIHIGKKSQVWQVTIRNEKNELVCISRMTLAVVDKRG